MSVQNKPRSFLPDSLVALACLASGNAAYAREAPARVPGGSAPGLLTTAFVSSSGDVATGAAGGGGAGAIGGRQDGGGSVSSVA